ncbi:DUF2569 domain-containing protein [Pirellulales bacterium]|nr:DUF2569 domain-containing protein [Pirellulales bacterium]
MVDAQDESGQAATRRIVSSASEAPKIGGLLILPGFGLVISPILYAASLIREVGSGNLGQIAEFDREYPGFQTAFTASTLCDILLVGCQVYVAIRFFKKLAIVPRLMVLLMLANLGLAILFCAWFTVVFDELDIDGVRAAVTAAIASSIWVPYFLFSKRVKDTFIVDPASEEEDDSGELQ